MSFGLPLLGHQPLGASSVVGAMVFVLAAWMMASLPVYLAAKAVTGGKASMVQSLVGTLMGPVVFFAVYSLVTLTSFPAAPLVAVAASFVALLWLYKGLFGSSWSGALMIALLAAIIFLVVVTLVGLFVML
ncbi:MAG: hypothetical protein JRN39_02920 [Nitrososphaerota archaeon]|nr:hypothetical protein [Nitrososphaerota archaeon]